MAEYINKKNVIDLFPNREQISNKATFGKVLNISGCKNYIGAAYLSSISPLKTGCGFVSLACVESIVPVIASMLPEITFIPLKEEEGCISADNLIEDMSTYNVVSIGCGLNTKEKTKEFFFKLISQINDNQKVVIDADGLNILSEYDGEISLKNTVITPHPKELSRLLNVSLDEILENREKYARISAQKYDCITVLKGHNTIITDGETIYINTTGNSALAKAGSGDVLTGMISAFLAQKLTPLDAAIVGVYLHGLSGEIASYDLTEYSVLASDVVDYIPFAIDETLMEE